MANNAFHPMTVPSHGIFYGEKLPEGKIEIRALTTGEEAILEAAGLEAVEKIRRIINNCLKLPAGFDPGELLLTDRQAILLAQRVISFGPEYEFTYKCPSCGKPAKALVNVVQDYDEVNPDVVAARMQDKGVENFANTEPFDVPLPDCGKIVSLRFLRGRDEQAIMKRGKRVSLQSTDSGDPSYYYRIALQIVAVDGIESKIPEKTETFVRSLTLRDSRKISISVDERETGMDTRVIVTCRNCGAENEQAFRYDAEFFRPSRV